MIDFDALVLGPAMDAFARPIVIEPGVSQPGASAYPARGVFDNAAVEETVADGYISTVQPILGIRMAEFPVPPKRGDRVLIDAITYAVHDLRPDGHGKASLILRRT